MSGAAVGVAVQAANSHALQQACDGSGVSLMYVCSNQVAIVMQQQHLTNRCIMSLQVLVTPVGRLKVSGLGVAEALTGEVVPQNTDDLTQLQRDDVVVSSSALSAIVLLTYATATLANHITCLLSLVKACSFRRSSLQCISTADLLWFIT